MYGIDILIKEHTNIVAFTQYLKVLCCDILKGNKADIESFKECVEFGRNYADMYHHGKEEKILYEVMQNKLGTAAQKLVQNGMLVEHDLGRYYLSELEKSLEKYIEEKNITNLYSIITYASGYADLLERHIEKEDNVCFEYALKMLTKDDKEFINEETKRFEKETKEREIQKKYEEWLKDKFF